MEVKEATVNELIIARPSDTSVLAAWRASPQHSAFEHALYIFARFCWTVENGELDVDQQQTLLIRKLARAFTPWRGTWRSLQRQLNFIRTTNEESSCWSNAGFKTKDEVDHLKALALYTLATLRVSPELFEQELAPPPPPRVKKPYVRG